MSQMMQFTKHGHTIEFDIPTWDEANPVARDYAYFYGWRQSIQDSYANSKNASEMEGACRKKYDKIVSGQLQFRFNGQAPRKSELDAEMESIVTARIEAHAVSKNLKLTRAKVQVYVAEFLSRSDRFEEVKSQAQDAIEARNVAAQNAVADDDFFAGLS